MGINCLLLPTADKLAGEGAMEAQVNVTQFIRRCASLGKCKAHTMGGRSEKETFCWRNKETSGV